MVIKTMLQLYAYIPESTRVLMYCSFALIVVDSLSGFVRYWAEKNISSHKMRIKLLYKITCYFAFISLAAITSILCSTWVMLNGAILAVIWTEFFSMVENITIFGKKSGVDFGPIQKYLDHLATVIPAAQDQPPPKETVFIQTTEAIEKDGSSRKIATVSTGTSTESKMSVESVNPLTQDLKGK